MATHNSLDDYKKDWLDWWLSDEQPPPSVESKLREAADNATTYNQEDNLPRRASPPSLVEEAGATYVTVNVHVPKIRIPSFNKVQVSKFLRTAHYQTFVPPIIFAICMMMAGLSVHSFLVKPNPKSANINEPTQTLASSKVAEKSQINTAVESNKTQITTQSLSSPQSNATPKTDRASFVPVAPADKPELGNYAFAKTSYDSTQGTYTYIDVMQGNVFSVTERETPPGYASSQEAAAKLSASVGAKELTSLPSGIIYAYTDSKTHHQTVIFSLSALLIYINSNSSYSGTDWATYINNLR